MRSTANTRSEAREQSVGAAVVVARVPALLALLEGTTHRGGQFLLQSGLGDEIAPDEGEGGDQI